MSGQAAGRVLFAMTLSALCATNIAAADSVTIGAGTQTGFTVDVPVYIDDLSGTPLGIDQPPGSRIQSYNLTVNYAPASAIQSVSFTRAGITAPLTPLFESSPSSTGTISLLDVFQESTNLIPFTSNAPAPGNQVAHLLFTFNSGVSAGTTVTLTLDPTLTQLSNQAGTTSETVTLGTLSLVNGSITLSESDLGITKTASGASFFAGLPFTYNMTVTNGGPATANSVVVTDTLPAGATFVSATPSQGSCGGTTTVTCNLGSMVNGATATIALKVTPTAAGPLNNTANVSAAPQPDPNSANNAATSSITVQSASAIPLLSGWMVLILVLTIAFAGLIVLQAK